MIEFAERQGGPDDPSVLAAVADALRLATAALQTQPIPAIPADPPLESQPRPAVESRAIEAAAAELEAAHRERQEALAKQNREREERLELTAHFANRVLEISDRRAWWANLREWLIDATTAVDRDVKECKGPITLFFKIIHHGLRKMERGPVRESQESQDVPASGS